MCRLYGFCATESTKVECTLVHAQNALMAQSERDLGGKSHAHGWGIATYTGEMPQVEKKAWAAYHGEHFERAASQVFANLVVAHVRRATVGGPAAENTHPFVADEWVFAHNGTVPGFDALRGRLLEAISPKRRDLILGQTDSEHVFHYLLTLMDKDPNQSLSDLVRRGVSDVSGWARDVDPNAAPGLNVIITDGQRIAGSRLGRSLFKLERDGVYDCEICGFPHIHHDPKRDYRAVVVASEPLTHEVWEEIPHGSVWSMNVREATIQVRPL